MARFTTGVSWNFADYICVFGRPQHTVYCVSGAGWHSPLGHSLLTTDRFNSAGRRQSLRHSTMRSASYITGVRFVGQAIIGSRERHEFR